MSKYDQMKADTDVLGHIRRENTKLRERAKREGWTFWMNTCESVASRYETVYHYELEMAREEYRNLYKEVHGCRPPFLGKDVTLEEVERRCEWLLEDY